MPIDTSTCTPLETMVLQMDERIRSLEEDRPVHELLGNYQEVSRALWECVDELQLHIVSPMDYVCMYLSLFQKLPSVIRVEQGWELVNMSRRKEYARIAHYIFHCLRCHGQREVLNHWRQHAPFVKQELPPGHRAMDSASGSLHLSTVTLPFNLPGLSDDP